MNLGNIFIDTISTLVIYLFFKIIVIISKLMFVFIVIFNPSAFYGHHEYDIAAISYFGDFPRIFFESYHKKIPKAKGFDNRIKLYTLFHLLSDWYLKYF